MSGYACQEMRMQSGSQGLNLGGRVENPMLGQAIFQLPDAGLTKVSQAGKQYKSSQVRHAKPVIQLTQVIRSPKKMKTTPNARIPWIKIRYAW